VAAEVREVMWEARQDGRPVSSAASAAGVSEMAAWAWIQQHGGVRSRRPVPPSGRFLSLAEREEIAAGAAAALERMATRLPSLSVISQALAPPAPGRRR
jgi:hypothetical protein